MRRSLFPNPFRFIILIVVVLFLLQGLPHWMSGGTGLRSTPASVPSYAPPAASPFNFMGLWETILPILTIVGLLFLGRIWFLLEKIASRLERNKLDINLNVRRD